jgi:RNA polymerase sigma-70 factor, ECF subfamily
MDDEEAQRARLVAAYSGLRRFAAVVGPLDADPDDLVQEAFVRALRRGLDGIDNLDAYLRRAVVNLSSNERRRWNRRQRAFGRHGVLDVAAVTPTYVDVADLFHLPPDLRAVLWLAEVESWTYAEIGSLLGCTEDAARTRASRARRRLRGHLTEEA